MTVTETRSWFSITNLGTNAAELWIYDEVGGWGVTASDFVMQLKDLNVSDITLHLNSPGGSVFDGLAILNALRDHPAFVTVKVDALAASIASVIAQAGNKVIMGRSSTMMIHNASGLVMGESGDMRKMADMLDQTTDTIAGVYVDRAGGTKAEWLALMAEETWYSAQEAVDAGLADEVAALPSEKKAHAMAANFDLSVFNHAPAIIADVPDFVATEPDPLVTEPTPLPTERTPVPTWNPAAFKDAIAASKPKPIAWNPDVMRGAVKVVTSDAPVQPVIVTAPTLPGLLAPEPEPVPVAGWSGTGLFKAAVSLVSNDMPSGPTPSPVAPTPGFDSIQFSLAIREAHQ
jgi:ATP-dependent protease ClpP protease subunit